MRKHKLKRDVLVEDSAVDDVDTVDEKDTEEGLLLELGAENVEGDVSGVSIVGSVAYDVFAC